MIVKQPYEKIGLCDEMCKKCVYRSGLNGNSIFYCQYILFTGKMRPCPAGRGCKAFKKGKPLSEAKSGTVVVRTIKECQCCGGKYEGTNWQKYCSKCRKAKSDEYNRNRQRMIRAQEREKALAKVRHCDWCGVEYHSFTDKSKYCQECSKRFTHRKRPKDE